jgi:hypothetical protein
MKWVMLRHALWLAVSTETSGVLFWHGYEIDLCNPAWHDMQFGKQDNKRTAFELFRLLCNKWQGLINSAVIRCLESKEYVQMRNALLVAARMREVSDDTQVRSFISPGAFVQFLGCLSC